MATNNSNGEYSQQQLIIRFLKGLIWWLIGAAICFIYSFMMLGLMQKFMVAKIVTAVCAVIIVNGLYCNYIYNCATDDKKLKKVRHVETDPKTGIKLALTVPIMQYASWIVLVLSKIGVIGDFFSIYIFMNMYTLGWVDLFTEERTISALSWGGIIGLLLLAVLSSVIIYLTYEITIRDIDVKRVVFYNRKK